MINFRYHVVSILAVFLALAIGTVMGASFVGRGLIDSLNRRISIVSKNASGTQDDNDKLRSQADKTSDYIKETAGFAVARTLTGVQIDLVAERGVDGGVVDAQATLLRQAGATVPGVIWLEDSWKVDTGAGATALKTATGLTSRTHSGLRVDAAKLLGQRLVPDALVTVTPLSPTTPPATATPAPPADDVLAALANAKFVTLAGVAGSSTPAATDFKRAASRVLEIGGPGHTIPADVVPAIAEGLVASRNRLVVGQVFAESDATPDRGAWIDAIANQGPLHNEISTVDDVERVEGRVGATLALAQLGSATVGNYGIGRERAVPDKVPTIPSAR